MSILRIRKSSIDKQGEEVMGLHCYLKISSRCHRKEIVSFCSYGSHGIVIDIFLTGVDFVLWTPPESCLRYHHWELCPLGLYILGKMVRLVWFALSLTPSSFFNLTPFQSPFLGAPRRPAITTPFLL